LEMRATGYASLTGGIGQTWFRRLIPLGARATICPVTS
jgi:hypothetical protein